MRLTSRVSSVEEVGGESVARSARSAAAMALFG